MIYNGLRGEIMESKGKYEIQKQQGKYIIKYSYHNGYRVVSYYVWKTYKNEYTWTCDYTHAKRLSQQTAEKHLKYLRVNPAF